MDAPPLSALHALDAATAAQALAEAVEALAAGEGAGGEAGAVPGAAAPGTRAPEGAARLLLKEGLAERLLGPAQAAGTQDPSGALPAAAHPAAETAMQQVFARPQPAAGEAPTPQQRLDADAPATADSGPGDFVLPDAQLAPALMVGLQVDPGLNWTLPQPTLQPPQEPARLREAASEREPAGRQGQDQGEAAPDAAPQEGDSEQETPPAAEPLVFDAADARLNTLLRALQAALRAADAPPALRAAAEQWRRGRCVIVACPQALQSQGAAWAFVLTPRQAAAGEAPRLAGPCFEARLQWQEAAPRGPRWCHARLVKEHHPRHGRRLVAADAAQALACGVQLGPVLAERRPPCAVTVRIAAARSFWNALGVQWSALLVVSSLPLAGGAVGAREEGPS